MILIVVENFLYGISRLFKDLTLEYFGIFCLSIGIRATAKFVTLQSMPPHLNISEYENQEKTQMKSIKQLRYPVIYYLTRA